MPNNAIFSYKTIPIGSILITPAAEHEKYFTSIDTLSTSVRELIASPRTGAYVRGLIKQFDLSEEFAPQIAFLILQVCIGDKALKDMAQTLQAELGVASTTSQLIAQDLEKELFQPLLSELTQYWQQQQQQINKATGAPNVLDLKNQN